MSDPEFGYTQGQSRLYEAVLEVYLDEGDEKSLQTIAQRLPQNLEISETDLCNEFGENNGLQQAVFAWCWSQIDNEFAERFMESGFGISVNTPRSRIHWALQTSLQITAETELARYAVVRSQRKDRIGLRPVENPEFPEDTEPPIPGLRSVYERLMELAAMDMHHDNSLEESGWTPELIAQQLMYFTRMATVSRMTGGQIMPSFTLSDEIVLERFSENLDEGPHDNPEE